jgi:hypothetical protein
MWRRVVLYIHTKVSDVGSASICRTVIFSAVSVSVWVLQVGGEYESMKLRRLTKQKTESWAVFSWVQQNTLYDSSTEWRAVLSVTPNGPQFTTHYTNLLEQAIMNQWVGRKSVGGEKGEVTRTSLGLIFLIWVTSRNKVYRLRICNSHFIK